VLLFGPLAPAVDPRLACITVDEVLAELDGVLAGSPER
jgi:hypothetical protein